MKKPNRLPGDLSFIEREKEIIRVNHSGEYGAKRIYQGQIAFTKDPFTHSLLEKMLSQELTHLQYFEEKIKEKKIRPSALFPLWHAGGYALGAFTALLGKKSTLICTEAVEEVIEDHYKSQINYLNNQDEADLSLKEKIIQFREEELEHHSIATVETSENSFFHIGLKITIKAICKVAIKLAAKI